MAETLASALPWLWQVGEQSREGWVPLTKRKKDQEPNRVKRVGGLGGSFGPQADWLQTGLAQRTSPQSGHHHSPQEEPGE